ncbi:hypothetical protein NADFUDRAFT_64922 [Nadsonia fulvescens var. elongata DSM 6958]|uniref:UPF3 domain-containing protein n=1 Tax=Nadsonia fulvescens var. elongata DSM 6958 TaxID=857566 RepID=A0A1E3PNB6_9ASCO|nr:hypothetical protein NADFUDRAFT_64922 [Nadsonia fulvescens var. elongata DSM 6958]
MESVFTTEIVEVSHPELVEVEHETQPQLSRSYQEGLDDKKDLSEEKEKSVSVTTGKSNNKASHGSSKSKKKLKIIVRQLPPTLDEEEFFDSIKEWVNDETTSVKYYVQGKIPKNPSKNTQVSRAYICFRNETYLIDFFNAFNGTVLSDLKNVKYLSLIEYAPFQAVPVESPIDKKEATIEQDSHYIRFVEGKDDPQPKASKKAKRDKKKAEKKAEIKDKDDKKKKKKKKVEKGKVESVDNTKDNTSKSARTRGEKKAKSKAAKEVNGDKKSANRNKASKKSTVSTEKPVIIKSTDSTPTVTASSSSTIKPSLPLSFNAQPFVPSAIPVFEPVLDASLSERPPKSKSNKKPNSARKKKSVKSDEAKTPSAGTGSPDTATPKNPSRTRKPAKKKEPTNANSQADKPLSVSNTVEQQQGDKGGVSINRRRNNKPKDGDKKSARPSGDI